ncbi:arsenate reductase (glutaredoxin) [Flavobacterium branchiophilum]
MTYICIFKYYFMIQIYHNSRCSKSRECLLFLEKSNKSIKVINYLEEIPNFKELKTIISKLSITPMELIRTKEKIWIEKYKNNTYTHDELIVLMVENPVLIERPIVVNGDKAVIARPLELINNIL